MSSCRFTLLIWQSGAHERVVERGRSTLFSLGWIFRALTYIDTYLEGGGRGRGGIEEVVVQERRRDEAAMLLPKGISHDCHLLQWALMSSAGCASRGGAVYMLYIDIPVHSPCIPELGCP